MTTTAATLRSDTGVSLFYYLKITGIPYYFFCAVDPTSTTYGTGAWTLPTGYTAVRGMDLPSDTLEQKMSDMVGGVASAERIRLTLRDFDISGSTGSYRFLSRLFSPGRMSAAGPLPELASQINVTDGAGASFQVINTQGAGGGGTVHIGGEAIGTAGLSAPDSTGLASVTIASRNQFPCSATYPPTPLHRVVYTSGLPGAANLGRNQRMTAEPYSLIGRSAAFYIGHMQPNGVPCLESETLCRLLARVTSIDVGKVGGEFELQLESILTDATNALVAPGLAFSEIQPDQISLPTWRWCSMEIVVNGGFGDFATGTARSMFNITIAPGVYGGIDKVVTAIQDKITSLIPANPAQQGFLPSVSLQTVDGVSKVAFNMSWGSQGLTGNSSIMTIRNPTVDIFPSGVGADTDVSQVGLLSALGFTDGQDHVATQYYNAAGTPQPQRLTADKAAPSIFYPIGIEGTGAQALLLKDPNAVLFADQGDGGGVAYARFNSSQMGRVLTPVVAGQIIIGAKPVADLYGGRTSTVAPEENYYYVPRQTQNQATIEQVILTPPTTTVAADPGTLLGRLMASTGSSFGSGNLDCYPQGIGLAWSAILDINSILSIGGSEVQRAAVVDSKTKLSDLLTALAKEYGFFLVWDPMQTKITARKVAIPTSPFAALPALTESNRVSVQDRTAQKIDQSALRSAWTLKWGWSRIDQKFLAPDVTIQDVAVISSYGASVKAETIEDKTLSGQSGAAATTVLGLVMTRAYLWRQPWLRCQRTLTKAGLLLAPGSVHQIVDATMFNPFTGAAGVAATDNLYALMTSVQGNPATGNCTVEFVVNRTDQSQQTRALSPCGLLDFAASGNGYSNSLGTVTFVSHFASDGISFDGIDFLVGDLVTLMSYNADQAPTYLHNTVITAVASDGHTVTVASGLGAIAGEEVIMVLQHYGAALPARKASIAFQGHESGDIEGTGIQNHRFS